MNELDGSEEEEVITVVLEEAKEKWDCESICSKYCSVHFTAKGRVFLSIKHINYLKMYVLCENDLEDVILPLLSCKQFKNI